MNITILVLAGLGAASLVVAYTALVAYLVLLAENLAELRDTRYNETDLDELLEKDDEHGDHSA